MLALQVAIIVAVVPKLHVDSAAVETDFPKCPMENSYELFNQALRSHSCDTTEISKSQSMTTAMAKG